MRTLLLVFIILLAPLTSWAKPWKGITPGASTRADVLQTFGEPTKKVKTGDKEVLAYLGEHAISGTTQAQFTVLSNGKVEQIVVFPATTLEITEIEDTYGGSCAAAEKAGKQVAACYSKMLNDEFRAFFWYKRLGLVVFFGDDKKTVQSITFTSPAAANATAVVQ
jgi:hypothetical protein